jgi:hypothetical protein
MPPSDAERHHRIARYVAMALAVAAVNACNPYACETEARSAEYDGRLGQAVAPTVPLTAADSGRVFILLFEVRGPDPQQSVQASVNVKGFATAVSELRVREGAPGSPGRLLWSTTNGYLVGDSLWNATDFFHGPASWADFWGALNAGHAYVEIQTPTDATVNGGLRQGTLSPYSAACT